MRLVDQFLLLMSRFMLGDTARLGLHRPKLGPLELKTKSGKTPVLDVGTLAKIKAGNIKVLNLLLKPFIIFIFFVITVSGTSSQLDPGTP